MNFYDKKVRRLVSIIILVVIVAMVATMVIPYLVEGECDADRESNADDLESFCKETDPKSKQEFNRKNCVGRK